MYGQSRNAEKRKEKAKQVSVRCWVIVVMMAYHENDPLDLVAAQCVQQLVSGQVRQIWQEGSGHLRIVFSVG